MRTIIGHLSGCDVQRNRYQERHQSESKLCDWRILPVGQQERTDKEKVREIYLAAFSREPTSKETAFVIEKIATRENKQQAWEDVIWAIFNAKEFQFVR